MQGKKSSNSWDKAAEGWADFVRTGKDYFRDHLNNPATFRLIGNIKGATVLDLACGEGYNTRILARKGAKVIGVDSSRKLIAIANAEEKKEPHGIRYYVMNANCLKSMSKESFDLITCFMALHDIQDYENAVAEAARVLKQGGRFVFSIPHPCFEKLNVNGIRIDAAERYFDRVEHPIYWNMERLRIRFRTTSFHRTLDDYSLALLKNGMLISRLIEPRATREAVRKYPNLKDELTCPQSIVFESVKRNSYR